MHTLITFQVFKKTPNLDSIVMLKQGQVHLPPDHGAGDCGVLDRACLHGRGRLLGEQPRLLSKAAQAHEDGQPVGKQGRVRPMQEK
jgi:hypothetical protein